MMSLRLVLQQLCCAHRTDASGHARFLDNRLQGATPALANVRRLSKGFGKVSTPVRIFYQSTGLDADRFDEAFRNSDLKAMVQLMDSKQAIENLLEPKHPWAEDPRTVGVLAALLMGLLASSVGEDDGAIREEVSNAGAIPALVRMLDSEDSDAEQTAVIALKYLTEDCRQSCGAAFECGAVPKLIQLLQHTLPGLRGAAASCLRNMCVDSSECHQCMAELGGISALVGQLDFPLQVGNDHDHDLMLEAVWNLEDMVVDTDGGALEGPVRLAVEAGAVDKLQKLRQAASGELIGALDKLLLTLRQGFVKEAASRS